MSYVIKPASDSGKITATVQGIGAIIKAPSNFVNVVTQS